MKKILLIVGIFLFLLVAFISFIPQLFHDKIEEVTLNEIKSQIKSNVDFKHLDISIWKNFPNLTIVLDSVSVSDKKIKGDTLLTSERIDCVIDIIDYVKDEYINLISVCLDRPIVNAWIAKDDTTNFLILNNDTSTATSGTSAINIHLKDIEIKNAFISYRDMKNESEFFLKDFSYEGSGEIGPETFNLKTVAQVESFSLKVNGKNYFTDKSIGIKSLLTVNSKEGIFTILEGNLKINSLALTLLGNLQIKKDRVGLNFTFNSTETELKDILSLASFFKKDMQGIETEGVVKFSGYTQGNYIPGIDSIPKFQINLEVSKGTFKSDSLPDAIENIHLDFMASNTKGLLDSTQLRLDTLFFQLKEHKVQGHVHVHGLKNLDIDAALKGSIHIDEILKVYPVKGIVAEGEINFDIQAEGKYASLGDNMAIPDFNFDIDIKNGKFKYDSLPEAISKINFQSTGHAKQGKFQDAEISIANLSLLMGDDPIKGNIKIKGLKNPHIQSSLMADMHLEDIGKFYPIAGLNMKGALKVNATINGVYNSSTGQFPKIDANVLVKEAYVKTENYPKPIEHLNLDLIFKNETGKTEDAKINFKQCGFVLEGDSFNLTGYLNDLKNYNYDLQMKGILDLGKITKIYPLQGMSLAGQINSDVAVKGSITDLEKGNYEKTKASGTLQLKKLYIKTDYLPKPIEIKSGVIALSPVSIFLKNLDMDCGKSCFKLNGAVKDYFCFFKNDEDLVEAKLNLDADTLDLNEWKDLFSTAPTQTTQPSKVWKVPETIDFDFDSDLKYVKYEEMIIKDMKGEIRIKDGILTLKETGFNALNASFDIGGTYNTRDIKHPLFDFDLNIQKLDIQKAYKGLKLIRDLAPAAAETEGVFSIKYEIKGELDQEMNPKSETLIGGGELIIEDAKINGMKLFDELGKASGKKEMNNPHLKEFTLVSEIKNNKLYLKPFAVKISGFHTEIEGVNDINGPISYQIKVDLLSIEKLKVPFNVSGTYSKPKVAIGKGAKLPDEKQP
ncbi:MAG: hypothetical protein HYX39_07255 [Bacteroidetes bacterium]|nr:hypothetical protein [Bacteroidota bacterium]